MHDWLERHRGEWVAVRDGEIVADGDDVFEVLDQAHTLPGDPYVACVGEEQREFVVRTQFSYDVSVLRFADGEISIVQ